MTRPIDPQCLVTTAEGVDALLREYQYLGTPLEIRTKIADLRAKNYLLSAELDKMAHQLRELNIKLDRLEGKS